MTAKSFRLIHLDSVSSMGTVVSSGKRHYSGHTIHMTQVHDVVVHDHVDAKEVSILAEVVEETATMDQTNGTCGAPHTTAAE